MQVVWYIAGGVVYSRRCGILQAVWYIAGGVVTNCSIKTMDADMALNFDFSTLNVNNKVIMKAEGLKESFNEIDSRSEVIELLMSPDPPYFRYDNRPPLRLGDERLNFLSFFYLESIQMNVHISTIIHI